MTEYCLEGMINNEMPPYKLKKGVFKSPMAVFTKHLKFS